MMRPQTISILGATGSVGEQAVALLEGNALPGMRVEAVTANRNARRLARIARAVSARFAAVADVRAEAELRRELEGSGIECGGGVEAVCDAARRPVDRVLAAISGGSGLPPTLAALGEGTSVALANKEALVCAGGIFLAAAAKTGAAVIPVDSEHNAIFQLLETIQPSRVAAAVLTASGGPFRNFSAKELEDATPEQALKHPVWAMGAKNSIDSATLMNKGLELIEAHFLFQLPSEKLEVLVHPQAVVHGLIRCTDGSLFAHLSKPDMKVPLAHALSWPECGVRAIAPSPSLERLEFYEPDGVRFPALNLAREALVQGGNAAATLSYANEEAVRAFQNREIKFTDIAKIVAKTLDETTPEAAPESLPELEALEVAARNTARRLVAGNSSGTLLVCKSKAHIQ